jgi:hypothetical protein
MSIQRTTNSKKKKKISNKGINNKNVKKFKEEKIGK